MVYVIFERIIIVLVKCTFESLFSKYFIHIAPLIGFNMGYYIFECFENICHLFYVLVTKLFYQWCLASGFICVLILFSFL